MPEHEAAQLLLSLSNHAASTSNQAALNHQLSTSVASWNENQTESQMDELTRQRFVILSTLKAGDFDLLQHEKYYSDPNLNRPKEIPPAAPSIVDDSDEAPMDLTKKPTNTEQRSARISDVITKFSEPAVLLNQLVSNIDKMPSNSIGLNINFTDNVQYNESLLPQEYITERALRDVRMKQSQHTSKSNEYHQAIISMATSRDHLTIQEDSPNAARQSTPLARASGNKNGLMDALAELASKSDKLEVKSRLISEDSPKTSNMNAKNVASEYLKLTQQKIQRTVEDSNDGTSDKESQETASILLTPQTIIVGEDGFRKKSPTASTLTNSERMVFSLKRNESGKPFCEICGKICQKESQLQLHMNIHVMERKFRCEPCGVSFRLPGHLQKHERSQNHLNKVNMTSTFGVPSDSNPRPFKCKDCKSAFRIHGHLAKHLRSKLHVLKLECLQKLPFGTYAEMERSGFNLTDIDTSDCDNSLMSLRQLAKKLNEKDPSKLGPLPALPNDEMAECDENYDSDSSYLEANANDDDSSLKRKTSDVDEHDLAKKIKYSTEVEHVPSNPSPDD